MAGPFKLKSGNNPEKKGFFGIKINPEGLIGRLTTKAKKLSKTRDFSKTEMQNLIVALVMSEKSAEIMDNFDYAKSFKNLREDIIKIKNKLVKKEE